MKRTYPVEILWCGNARAGCNNGWSFPGGLAGPKKIKICIFKLA